MHHAAHAGYLDATQVLETLVMQGVPFRDAHHQVGAWVAEAMEKSCSLAEIMRGLNLTLRTDQSEPRPSGSV